MKALFLIAGGIGALYLLEHQHKSLAARVAPQAPGYLPAGSRPLIAGGIGGVEQYVRPIGYEPGGGISSDARFAGNLAGEAGSAVSSGAKLAGSVGGPLAMAGPIGALAAAGVGIITSLISLNKPYGKCSPNAPDMIAFLQCWQHAIPDNYLPRWKGGAQGWAWAWCPNAKGAPNGKAWLVTNQNFRGCGGGCNCSSGACVCAPVGAVMAQRDGSFLDFYGRPLGLPTTRNP